MNTAPEDIRLSLQRAVALLQDSLGNGSMIGLAETVSAVLGWSAAVMDPALRVLSGGTKVPLRESERNAIEGCRAGVLARAADRSLSVCEPGMAASELYLPLRGRGEQLLGILCLYRDIPAQLDPELAQLCVLALRMRLQERSLLEEDRETALIRVLEEVLQGTVTDPAYISRMLAAERFPKKRNLCFVFVETSRGPQRRPDAALAARMTEIWPLSFQLVIQSNLVLLVCTDEPPLNEGRRSRYSQVLTQAGLYGGVSEVFHRVDQYLGYYLCRAVCAAKAADRLNLKQRFASFDQVAPTAVLFAEKMPYGIRKCCDPKLIQLLEQDRNSGTEYVRTLMTYWRFREDRDAAAGALRIHRNTLAYRLRRIEDHLECTLSDPGSVTSVYFSLSVLRCLGELDGAEFPM